MTIALFYNNTISFAVRSRVNEMNAECSQSFIGNMSILLIISVIIIIITFIIIIAIIITFIIIITIVVAVVNNDLERSMAD